MNSFLPKIRTVEERDKLLEEIEILLKNMYEHQGTGLFSALKSQVRSWVAQEIENGLSENPEKSQKYLENIKQKLSELKVISLKIAFEPSESTIDKFINYTRQNVDQNVILDIEIDPEILAGAQITYKGEFRDFSLSRLFEHEYDSKKDEIRDLIKHKST